MANTMSGGKFFVCVTPQNQDLTEAEFEALNWVHVKGIGSHGETGNQQNVVGYDTWDLLFQQKAKGIANAGDPDVEIARIAGDPGQVAFRGMAAARNPNAYATKIERNDAPEGGSPTKFFNRGVITGPRTQHGRNENFDLEVYTIGCTQEQVTVEASLLGISGVAPAGVDSSAYTFTPVVTGSSGAVTYEWFGDDLAQHALAFNAATGAISSAALDGAGTVNGIIRAKDNAGNAGVLRVSITIS